MGIFDTLSRKLLPQSVEDVFRPAIDIADIAIGGGQRAMRTEQGQATAISVPGTSRQMATETAFSGEVSAMSPIQSYTGILPQILQRAPQIVA